MQARLLAAATILAVAATSAGAAGPKTPAKKGPVKAPANSCAGCVERGAVLDSKLFADSRFEPEVVPAFDAAR